MLKLAWAFLVDSTLHIVTHSVLGRQRVGPDSRGRRQGSFMFGTLPDLTLCILSFGCFWYFSTITKLIIIIGLSWVPWVVLVHYWTWRVCGNTQIYRQLFRSVCGLTTPELAGIWSQGSLVQDCVLTLWKLAQLQCLVHFAWSLSVFLDL